MRKIALLLVITAFAASGCQVWTGVSTTARPDENGNEAAERTSAIYAAAIRQLVTEDAYIGAGPPFERVFVVRTGGDRYVGTENRPRPFASAVERGMLEALRDLPVRLVADSTTVLVDERSCRGPAVRRGGVLIGVGPAVRARGDAVTVATWVVSGCLGKNGQWLTYVLEPRGDRWRVVGIKDIAIG